MIKYGDFIMSTVQMNESAIDDLFNQLVTDFQIREDVRVNRQLIEQIRTYN